MKHLFQTQIGDRKTIVFKNKNWVETNFCLHATHTCQEQFKVQRYLLFQCITFIISNGFSGVYQYQNSMPKVYIFTDCFCKLHFRSQCSCISISGHTTLFWFCYLCILGCFIIHTHDGACLTNGGSVIQDQRTRTIQSFFSLVQL